MKSNLFNLNLNDLLKGLVVSFVTAGLTSILSALQLGVSLDWKGVLAVSVSAGASYLLKNFSENSNGEILKK